MTSNPFVRNTASVWTLYLESRTWRTTPSQMFEIDDRYVAYCFDEAVAIIGNHISYQLDKVEGKTQKQIEGRRNAVLNRMLGLSPKFKSPIPTK